MQTAIKLISVHSLEKNYLVSRCGLRAGMILVQAKLQAHCGLKEFVVGGSRLQHVLLLVGSFAVAFSRVFIAMHAMKIFRMEMSHRRSCLIVS